MPVASMFVDPMLTPFRNMMKEVESKGLAGPPVEEMRTQLEQMERLAQEMDDVAAYTGRLAQDQTFQKFSTAYGEALSSAARQSGPPSDDELLRTTLAGYQSALDQYQSGQAGKQAAALIPHLERLLAMGRSGVSYPTFLRRMEEEGLTAVLQGTAPLARAGMEQDLGFARTDWNRYGIVQAEQILAAFDQLAAGAPFGQPDPLALSLMRRRIEWDLAPLKLRYEAVVSRWQYLLSLLVDWVDAFTRFAPYDPRWRFPGSSEADVRRNIQETQECTPAELRYRETLCQSYFHLRLDELWTHETFVWEYTARRVEWSDERLQLIRATYPHCQPGGRPPAELVARAEALHPDRDYRPQRLQPPPWGTPLAAPPSLS